MSLVQWLLAALLVPGGWPLYVKIETWHTSITCSGPSDMHYQVPRYECPVMFDYRDILVMQPRGVAKRWVLCSTIEKGTQAAPALVSFPALQAAWTHEPRCVAVGYTPAVLPGMCVQIGTVGSIRIGCLSCAVGSLPMLTSGNALTKFNPTNPEDCRHVNYLGGCIDVCPAGYTCCYGCLTNSLKERVGSGLRACTADSDPASCSRVWDQHDKGLVRAECSCCVEISVFYNCNGCSRCTPSWKHPVHRSNTCPRDLTRTDYQMLGSRFNEEIVPCKKWDIRTTANDLWPTCIYDDSELVQNRVSGFFAGKHKELKMTLRGTSQCMILNNNTGLTPPPCETETCLLLEAQAAESATIDVSLLELYQASGFAVGSDEILISSSYGHGPYATRLDSVLAGTITATSLSLTEVTSFFFEGTFNSTFERTMTGTCVG